MSTHSFAVQGVGLSTYSQAGYADSSVVEMIQSAVANGANYVEFSNIVLADLATGAIGHVIENGVDQTAPLSDVARATALAHQAGLKVMLKPQIAVHDPAFDQYNSASWINMVNPGLTISDPAKFFANYKAHLLEWAAVAEQQHVELFSIGNEMVAATKPQYTAYWNDIIDAVRQVYHGELTYSALAPVITTHGANEITQIGFWSKLDVAGFDVYPDLVDKTNPSVAELEAGWRDASVYGVRQNYVDFLDQMAKHVGKPVIFTETGLPSFDGASDRQATSDGNIDDGVHGVDQQEQADWWEAFFRTWAQNKPAWLQGVIVNNNDPGELGAYYDTNYNINGKLAEKVITAWYGGKTAIAADADALTGSQADDHLYLYGSAGPGAANQAGSLTTEVKVTLTGSILSGQAPVLHAYVNGVDKGQFALKPVDSGYVGAGGVHYVVDQTFTFEMTGLTRIDQLQFVMDSPASIGGVQASTFFHEVEVNGVDLLQASYVPAAGGAPIATLMPVNGVGGNTGQWAGGTISFDATPWNNALGARAIGSAADPILVNGQGGVDTVHVLGAPSQYSLTRLADGVHLNEGAGLGQNAVLNGVAAVEFADGARVSLADLTVVGQAYRFGGVAADVISGSAGSNYLRGGDGADTLVGGAQFDNINGNVGADSVTGGTGDDWLNGGRDDDVIQGGDGRDAINGNLGEDTLQGGAGADIIRGGQGDDVVMGGAGDDWLSGDRGSDVLTGGSGADLFHSFAGAGLDRITDFNLGDGDRVLLSGGATWSLGQVGADAVITLGSGDQVVLAGVQASSLPAGAILLG